LLYPQRKAALAKSTPIRSRERCATVSRLPFVSMPLFKVHLARFAGYDLNPVMCKGSELRVRRAAVLQNRG